MSLAIQNLANSKNQSKQSNGRCLRGMLITAKAPTNVGLVVLYISAWASALLILTGLGNARAVDRGIGNRLDAPAFLLCIGYE